MKKGFTLVELLAVIAIIGILSIIVVPSIIKINDNINKRLYAQKKENVESAAVLYASNNEDIFNGLDEVTRTVNDLIVQGYLTADVKKGESGCSDETYTKGCMINPIDKTSMNNDRVLIRRAVAGFKAEYVSSDANTEYANATRLVDVICNKFDSNPGQGIYGGSIVSCHCVKQNGVYSKIVDSSNHDLYACLFAGSDGINNYLKYGSSSPNWRVLGVYKLNEVQAGQDLNLDGTISNVDVLSAKIVTSDSI